MNSSFEFIIVRLCLHINLTDIINTHKESNYLLLAGLNFPFLCIIT